MVTLQSVQSHTGLTQHFYFFWRSGTLALRIERQSARTLSARVHERQKKNGGLDQYGFLHFVV